MEPLVVAVLHEEEAACSVVGACLTTDLEQLWELEALVVPSAEQWRAVLGKWSVMPPQDVNGVQRTGEASAQEVAGAAYDEGWDGAGAVSGEGLDLKNAERDSDEDLKGDNDTQDEVVVAGGGRVNASML